VIASRVNCVSLQSGGQQRTGEHYEGQCGITGPSASWKAFLGSFGEGGVRRRQQRLRKADFDLSSSVVKWLELQQD
ncbi:hypothetical protein GBF38_005622, partial [Nibea albiflora]